MSPLRSRNTTAPTRRSVPIEACPCLIRDGNRIAKRANWLGDHLRQSGHPAEALAIENIGRAVESLVDSAGVHFANSLPAVTHG